MVAAGDMDRDYKLQKKINDVENVLVEPSICAINKLADKLIAQKTDDSVEKHKASFNDN